MSDRENRPLVYGLRLGVWYATLFIAGSLTIVLLTYFATSALLAQRDRQIINSKLGTYAAAYASGGLDGLTEVVRAEQLTAPERLFVRVRDWRGVQAIVLSQFQGWDEGSLETGEIRLSDGTLLQVGKSTDLRDDVLARFRAALGLVTLSIFIIALTGGALATQSAQAPIRKLIAAVERIIRTGRTDERVPLVEKRDAIDELSALFNQMLDRIEGLVTGMRGALDNVSHDLRTPMTRLRGSAELALAGPADLDRYREALADCVEEADRVLVMLTTLMDISEAESGAIELHREMVPLIAIVDRAVDLYRDTAEAKGVTLESYVDDSVVASIDRLRLEQVAANLLDNAIKYTPSGGRVDISVAREGSLAVLRIRDSGIGIPATELPRIWERLFRGDQSRTERGLGLGLSLVKAIVEAHGGSVNVESTPGQGSTFTVNLQLTT
ncbi:MAG TPA: HAMP domain-containing sensor histidine kinase [Vicinamibacterales bacterium]|nr:HAMP domain-containing sensor histidine kinase [Vicinamibacterales bacterium]